MRDRAGRAVSGLRYDSERECWVAPTPAEITAARVAAEKAEKVVQTEQVRANEANYVLEHYVRGSAPRQFIVDGEVMGAGPFTNHFAYRFGYDSSSKSLYIALNRALINAGLRVREYAGRTRTGRNPGSHYPKGL